MDGGIKKLWSRKKSLGSADQPSHHRKLSSSNGISGQAQTPVPTTRDGRPSMSSLRHLERSFSRDKFGPSRDVASTPAGDNPRPSRSGPRIQPMLVGISRPETGNARPDTSGSLQTAVQKAADSVNSRPPEVPASPSAAVKPLQSLKSLSRHVDIFSVAASIPTYSSAYNEEIAERNLDTYRLVLENTPYIYDPSSKYQEEVAIRNAYLPYRPRTSSDTLRDHERSGSMTSRSMRNATPAQPNGTHSYRPSTDSTSRPPRSSHDQASSHRRQLSQRSHDSVPVSSAPQEYVALVEPEAEQGLNIMAPESYSPVRTTGQNYNTREARMSTIAEGLPYETRPLYTTRSPMIRDSADSSNAFSDHKTPVAEYNDRLTTNRSSTADYSLSPGMSSEAMFGPPSTRSVVSNRKIVLGNRTIMDLTNDDSELFSETSSAFGYSNYSPIIEQARSDAFRRIQPSQINTEERRASGDPAGVLNRAMKIDTAPHTIDPDPDTTPTAPNPVLRNTASPSGFSPINTVASWSPRSSAYVASSAEPVSMTAKVTAALEAANKPAGRPTSIPSKKGDETPTVKERVATFEEHVERSVSPPQRAVTPGAQVPPADARPTSVLRKVTPPPLAPPKPAVEPAVEPVVLEALPKAIQPQAQPVQIETAQPEFKREPQSVKVQEVQSVPTVKVVPAKLENARVRSQPEPVAVKPLATKTGGTAAPVVNGRGGKTAKIYVSPESTQSATYTAPSDNFGIRTRDFAITPRENDVLVKKATITPKSIEQSRTSTLTTSKAEPKKKAVKAATKAKAPAAVKSQEPSFDEEAFARKRAEAKAALEKLQKSLNEDFITLPDRATVKDKGKKRESDSAPAPLTSVVPQAQRDSVATNASSQRGEHEKPPPSSYRNSRGEQRHRSSLASTRSLSTGSQSSRRAPAPSTLKNIEPAINPIQQSMLSPALLQAMQMTSKPPKSPGEISLSSFPVPSSSRPPSQPDVPSGFHSHTNSFVGIMKRRNSAKSQTSTTSAFSIPYHMVPGRVSSVRDPVPEEVDPIWA